MKVIGIAGESGAGKNIFAAFLAARLVHLGYRAVLDSFGAPIKWECRAAGWKGQKTRAWRRLMQAIADAISSAVWMSEERVAFWEFPRVEYWRLEMMRLERQAMKTGQDKLAVWLGYRNGLEKSASGQWEQQYMESKYESRADFLIIPDVRRRQEAEFCKENGVVLFLEGTHEQLTGEEAAHDSEMSIQALRDDADFIVPQLDGFDQVERMVERIIDEERHLKNTVPPVLQKG